MKVLIGSIIVAVILIMSSCIFITRTHKHEECPICEECTKGIEDPYMCSKYYADKANPQLQIGSHDFFLEDWTYNLGQRKEEQEEEMMIFYRMDNQGVCNGEGCEEIHP